MSRALAFAALMLLGACFKLSDFALQSEVSQRLTTSDQEITGIVRQRGENASGVRIAGRPWYGSERDEGQGVRENGQALPDNLERMGGVALSIPTRTSLAEAAQLVSRTSGIPVALNLRLPAGGGEGEGGAAPTAEITALGQPIQHDGPLSALLDRLAGEYDVGWRFDGGAITLTAFETRTWPLPVIPGTSSVSSDFSGLSGGADSVSISRTAEIDDWAEIERLVSASIAAPPAVVTMSPSIGRVSVTGRPSDLVAAGAIIEQTAALASHRISFEVGIYYLDADRSREFSRGLTRFAEFDGPEVLEPATELRAAAGKITILGAEANLGLGYQLDFEDVAANDAVITHRTASTVTVSGSPAPIRLVSTRNYVSSVSVSEEGQQTIETDSVDDGISIQIIPRLIDRETLRLSLTVGQADLLGFDVFSNVQLPRVDVRMLANDVVMAPGETLVLSGYEQGSANLRDESGLLLSAGASGIERVMLVILVRPTLLPHPQS